MRDRERQVLHLYYYENLTLAQIGQVLGVTESRVSQIHSGAVEEVAREPRQDGRVLLASALVAARREQANRPEALEVVERVDVDAVEPQSPVNALSPHRSGAWCAATVPIASPLAMMSPTDAVESTGSNEETSPSSWRIETTGLSTTKPT